MKQEKKLDSLATRYRVDDGRKFRLSDFDPGDTAGLSKEFKDESEELLQRSTQLLAEMQDKLYAQDRWGLLLIFQAMDAAGKDGTIKHVMSGVNPQGCEVFSFKAPSGEELNHGYLWRTSKSMPGRGRIGIFNRSYYEEVLVVRVHPEMLEAERIPEVCRSKNIWKERFEDIGAFERYATRNGTAIRKFYLNVSKQEQKSRFLSRLEEPEKNWKFSATDVRERRFWDEYQESYEDMIRHTSSKDAPWIVVPADNKWFARLVVSTVIVDALKDMKLAYPEVSPEKRKELGAARRELEGKTKPKKT
ncbi:MAG TPA: polyphosphate kinase 2 family protein [Candidatus Saccharimonadales bacterium]|nr:polyphosphate kinase 2 family protein [Candidatus Saccharimonadales bacterium]